MELSDAIYRKKPPLAVISMNRPETKNAFTFAMMDSISKALLDAKADNGIKDIPVVILSAKDRMSELFKAEGIKDFLVKPCRADDLLAVVKKYLGERPA